MPLLSTPTTTTLHAPNASLRIEISLPPNFLTHTDPILSKLARAWHRYMYLPEVVHSTKPSYALARLMLLKIFAYDLEQGRDFRNLRFFMREVMAKDHKFGVWYPFMVRTAIQESEYVFIEPVVGDDWAPTAFSWFFEILKQIAPEKRRNEVGRFMVGIYYVMMISFGKWATKNPSTPLTPLLNELNYTWTQRSIILSNIKDFQRVPYVFGEDKYGREIMYSNATYQALPKVRSFKQEMESIILEMRELGVEWEEIRWGIEMMELEERYFVGAMNS